MPTKKKKQSRLSRVNFRSAKTRGVIILLAFALVGGGVMVYRSFANNITYIANAQNGKFLTSDISPCVTKPDTDTAKGVSAILRASCLGSGGVATLFSTAMPSNLPGGSYQSCATVRSANPGPVKFSIQNNVQPLVNGNTGSGPVYGSRYDFTATTGYNTYCTPNATSGSPSNLVSAKIEYREPGSLYVTELKTVKTANSPGGPMQPVPDPKCEIGKNC